MTEPIHRIEGDTLTCCEDGVTVKCTCGWRSGGHFSSMAAYAIFLDHVRLAKKREERHDEA